LRSSIHRRPRKRLACGSSSYRLRPSFRVSRSSPATRCFQLSSSFLEVSCLIAPSASQVRSSRRVPYRRRLPSSGFRNLSTVCSPRRIASLFHPAGTSRLFPSGVFPLQKLSRLVADTLPSCGYLGRSSSCEAKQSKRPFRALLLWRIRRTRPRLSEPCTRSPLGIPPLQGILRFGRERRFRHPPLSSFLPRSYGTSWTGSSGSSRAEGSVTSLARRPAFLRFVAFSHTHAFGSGTSRAHLFASGGAPRHRSTASLLFDLRLSLPAGAT